MARSLMNKKTVITFDTESVDILLSGIKDHEREAKFYQASISSDEVEEDVMSHSVKSLNSLSDTLKSKDTLNAMTFETLKESAICTAQLLNYELTTESVSEDLFNADKDAIIGSLETTVEGFVTDIKNTIGRVTRKIINGTKNLMASLAAQQKKYVKLAEVLQREITKYQEGNVDNKVISVPGQINKWFASEEDVVTKITAFNALRRNMPVVQDELRKLPTLMADSKDDFPHVNERLMTAMHLLVSGSGIKLETESEGDYTTTTIDLPSIIKVPLSVRVSSSLKHFSITTLFSGGGEANLMTGVASGANIASKATGTAHDTCGKIYLTINGIAKIGT